MQVGVVANIPVGLGSQAAAEGAKGAESAVKRSDLQAAITPVTRLEASGPGLSATSTPPLVYARPIAQATTYATGRPTGESGTRNGQTSDPVGRSVRGEVAAQATGRSRPPAEDEASGDTRSNASPDGESAQAQTPREREAEARGLTAEELEQVQQLAQRDREVRQHEQAHLSVGGSYTGAPSYEFRRGPDGKTYAVNGEVPIDVAPIAGDPEATIRKMQTVKAAALAPAEPSSQDRSVAALATQQLLSAQSELARERLEESDPTEEEGRQEAQSRQDSEEPEESRQDRQSVSNSVGNAIRTYEELIELGQQLGGNRPPPDPFRAIA